MTRCNYAHFVVSQNVDGLHLRSGLPATKLAELHGNCFLEICWACKKEFLRSYDVFQLRGPYFTGVIDEFSESGLSHITGRKCDECGEGMLRDSVIHFGENLPAHHLAAAWEHAGKSGVSISLGSSMHVTPACDVPLSCTGPAVIVNRQATGRDTEALKKGGVLIHRTCDEFMERLLIHLGIALEEEILSAPQPATDLHANTQAENSKPAGIKDPSFFQRLGLPSTLSQLPPHAVLHCTCTANTFRASVSAPAEYPLDLTDFVEKVLFTCGPEDAEAEAAATQSTPTVVTAAESYKRFTTAGGRKEGFVLHCEIFFAEGFGEASNGPLHGSLVLPAEGDVSLDIKVPRMKMAKAIFGQMQAVSLRPTRTRVTAPNGSVTFESRDAS